MDEHVAMVRAFHGKIGAPCRDSPELMPGDRARASRLFELLMDLISDERQIDAPRDELLDRTLLSLEELAEWLDAHLRSDLVAAADAWGDRAYVLFGDAVASGLPATAVFAEIHRSNMTKDRASAYGKAKKGRRFERPSLAALLAGEKQPRCDEEVIGGS